MNHTITFDSYMLHGLFHGTVNISKTCLYVYKANQNLLPYYVQNKYLASSQIYSYSTRSNSNWNMFKHKVKKSIKYMCTRIKGVNL